MQELAAPNWYMHNTPPGVLPTYLSFALFNIVSVSPLMCAGTPFPSIYIAIVVAWMGQKKFLSWLEYIRLSNHQKSIHPSKCLPFPFQRCCCFNSFLPLILIWARTLFPASNSGSSCIKTVSMDPVLFEIYRTMLEGSQHSTNSDIFQFLLPRFYTSHTLIFLSIVVCKAITADDTYNICTHVI